MGIFYDASVTLIGEPTNYIGSVIVWSFAGIMATFVSFIGFLFVAMLMRKLL